MPRDVLRDPDVEHRFAVHAQIGRIGKVVLDPEREQVVQQVARGAGALAAPVLPHDAELDTRQKPGLEQPVMNRMPERLRHRGVEVRAIPAVNDARDAVLDPILDVPVGHFRVALVVPSQHRLALRPGLDGTPASVRARLPQRTIMRPQRVAARWWRHGFGDIIRPGQVEPIVEPEELVFDNGRRPFGLEGCLKHRGRRPRGPHGPGRFAGLAEGYGSEGTDFRALERYARRRGQRGLDVESCAAHVPDSGHDCLRPAGAGQGGARENVHHAEFRLGLDLLGEPKVADGRRPTGAFGGGQPQRQQAAAPALPGPGLDHVSVRLAVRPGGKANASRAHRGHKDQLPSRPAVQGHPQAQEVLLPDRGVQSLVQHISTGRLACYKHRVSAGTS